MFELGAWHAEVDRRLPIEDFASGACFMQGGPPTAAAPLPTATAHALAATAGKASAKSFKAHVPAGGAAAPARPRAAGGAAGEAAGLHDPRGPGAIVLNSEQWADGGGRLASGAAVVPVVIDP